MQRKWKVLLEELAYFLVRADRAPPSLVLLQIGYLTIFDTMKYSTIVLAVAVIFSLIKKTNYFWYVGIIIHPGLGDLTILNFLAGLLSCNERWKFFLFTYIVVFFLTFSEKNLHYGFNIIALSALTIETYSKLPFSLLSDNRSYFVGFTCMLAYFAFNFFLTINELDWDLVRYSAVIVVAISYYVACTLIDNRLWALGNSKIEELGNPTKVYHYLNAMKERSNETLERRGIESIHRLSCRQPDCFCQV